MEAVLKPLVNSETSISVSNDTAVIQSGVQSLSLNKQDGMLVSGPIGFTSAFNRIKWSGMFRFNTLLASTMPSTMISPVPTFELDIPFKEAAMMSRIAGMLGGL